MAEEHNHTGKWESNPFYYIIKHHLIDLVTVANEETTTNTMLHSFCVSSGLSLK